MGDTIVLAADEELLAEFGSLVVAVTVAVLVEREEELKELAVTSIVTVTSPPTLTLPSEQVTVVVEEVYVQVPCEVDADV